MINDQIQEILKQREYQSCNRESEPKLVRLEPRQIRSVSVVGDNNEDLVYAKIKNRLFCYQFVMHNGKFVKNTVAIVKYIIGGKHNEEKNEKKDGFVLKIENESVSELQ